MTADKLREMVAAATPGPWEYRQWGIDGDEWPDSRVSVGRATPNGEAITINPRYGEREQDLANAALIALAPELAEVAAEMAESLEALHAEVEMAEAVGTCLPDRVPSLRASDALVRFVALGGES